jgi:hypothetical protein
MATRETTFLACHDDFVYHMALHSFFLVDLPILADLSLQGQQKLKPGARAALTSAPHRR